MAIELIDGLTEFTCDSLEDFNKRMLITFTNDGWIKREGIDEYIDKAVNDGIEWYDWDERSSLATGEYWKYAFHITDDNVMEQDKKLALKCLKKAYKLGSGDAAAQIGYYYYTGTEIADKPNMKKAKKLFLEACAKRPAFVFNCIIAKALSSATENVYAQKAALQQYENAIAKRVPFDKKEVGNVCLRIADHEMKDKRIEEAETYAQKALDYFSKSESDCKDCELRAESILSFVRKVKDFRHK